MNLSPKTRQTALLGLLFALALALAWLESLLPSPPGLPPGIKLGLANLVVMYVLLYLSRWQALLLVALKAAFALLTRGAVAGLLSGAGGLLSFLVVAALLLPRHSPSVLLLSVCGAVSHNMAQLAAVRLLFGPVGLYYAPVLLAAGVALGSLNAVLLRALLPALEKLGATSNLK